MENIAALEPRRAESPQSEAIIAAGANEAPAFAMQPIGKGWNAGWKAGGIDLHGPLCTSSLFVPPICTPGKLSMLLRPYDVMTARVSW